MATVPTQEYRDIHGHFGHSLRFAVGESAAEAVCGASAIVLAIIGLANPEWTLLAPIAAIAVGGALIFAGATACTRCMAARGDMQSEVGASMSAEFLGGIAGVVLGILAIIGLVPGLLVSAAVITFGTSLLLGSLATADVGAWTAAPRPLGEETRFVVHGSPMATGSQALVGLATTVLGIVALVGEASTGATLNLIALLVVAAGVLLTATALTSRIVTSLSR
jgi:hypothetical protein